MNFTLTDSVLGTLPLDCAHGYVITNYDLGWPDVRAVVNPRTNADGMIDTTAWFGARTVSLNLALNGNKGACAVLRDQLAAFVHPARRPVLTFQEDFDTRIRAMSLRGAQSGAPISHRLFNQMAVSWLCPNGIMEASVGKVTTVFASSSSGTVTGIVFPITFPITFPSYPVEGQATVVNAGTADAYPILRMYGPIVDPYIDQIGLGQRLAFTGLTIPAGSYVEINTRTKTVLFLSDPNQSQYDKIDYTVSSWWRLLPGVNLIRYQGASFSPPANLEIRWSDVWI